MRFSRRTLIHVFPALSIASAVTVFAPGPAHAQDLPKTDAGATSAIDSTAGSSEVPDPKPLLEKGEAALKAGDYAGAMAAFNDAGRAALQALTQGAGVEAGKAQDAALIGRGRAQVGLRDFEAAERDFRSVLQNNPENVPALIGLGQLKLEDNKPDEALDQFKAAVKADATNGEALFGLGKSLVLLGQADEAIASLTRAIAIDPKKAEAYRLRGMGYAAMYKNKQAIEDIKKAIELDPDDYEAYYSLGVLDIRAEDYKAAVEELNRAIEHYKPKPGQEDQPYLQGFLTRANAYIELGKAAKDPAEQKAAYQASYDAAEKAIKQLDEKNPAHAKALAAALYARGISERMMGQLGTAIRTLTHAIELRTSSSPDEATGPYLADAYFRRGICFHLIGEDKMAISDFETSAHLVGGDPRANLWEGFTYAKLGDYQEALRAYGDAIAASDRFTPAYYNRGLAYMMMGNYTKAVADFNDAIRLEPANAEYYFNRGVAFQLMGKTQKAADSFAAAIEFDKNHVGAHRHMAEVQQKLGHSELAAEYREKAKKLAAPKAETAKSAQK
jgi:tetratricopeptide (TPR) repeat protein